LATLVSPLDPKDLVAISPHPVSSLHLSSSSLPFFLFDSFSSSDRGWKAFFLFRSPQQVDSWRSSIARCDTPKPPPPPRLFPTLPSGNESGLHDFPRRPRYLLPPHRVYFLPRPTGGGWSQSRFSPVPAKSIYFVSHDLWVLLTFPHQPRVFRRFPLARKMFLFRFCFCPSPDPFRPLVFHLFFFFLPSELAPIACSMWIFSGAFRSPVMSYLYPSVRV